MMSKKVFFKVEILDDGKKVAEFVAKARYLSSSLIVTIPASAVREFEINPGDYPTIRVNKADEDQQKSF